MPGRIERTVRIVTNVRGGGFGLSPAAAREIARRKGLVLREEMDRLFVGAEGYDRLEHVLARDDADLVAVVEEMGEAADGPSARLVVGTYRLVAEVTEDEAGRESVAGWIADA